MSNTPSQQMSNRVDTQTDATKTILCFTGVQGKKLTGGEAALWSVLYTLTTTNNSSKTLFRVYLVLYFCHHIGTDYFRIQIFVYLSLIHI